MNFGCTSMAAVEVIIFSSSFFLLSLALTEGATDVCKSSYCQYPLGIRFPFRLKDSQPQHCGYEGFDLSCNEHNQTVINFPFSGYFIVESINYGDQTISVSDPDSYLPKRILKLNISNTPFRATYTRNYMFISCSSSTELPWSIEVPCLSGKNYTVYVTMPGLSRPPCHEIATVSVPVWCRRGCDTYFSA